MENTNTQEEVVIEADKTTAEAPAAEPKAEKEAPKAAPKAESKKPGWFAYGSVSRQLAFEAAGAFMIGAAVVAGNAIYNHYFGGEK